MAKGKKSNVNVEEIFHGLLKEGLVPTLKLARAAGALIDNAVLSRALRDFKERHADEIVRVKNLKKADRLTVEAACQSLMKEGRIPTFQALRDVGIKGDTAVVTRALRDFKEQHAAEISALRVEHSTELASRGVLTSAVKYWCEKALAAEKALEELKSEMEGPQIGSSVLSHVKERHADEIVCVKDLKKCDSLSMEEACQGLLKEGLIPTLKLARGAGVKGDAVGLGQALKEFKKRHADEIDALRIKRVTELSGRGLLNFAVKYWRKKALAAEKALEALKSEMEKGKE